MMRQLAITPVSILAFALALAVAGATRGATWYPGYYVAPLLAPVPTYPGTDGPGAPQGWSLLSNGTVVGDVANVPAGSSPSTYEYTQACYWTVNGSAATMTPLGQVEATVPGGTQTATGVFGDDSGQYGVGIYLGNSLAGRAAPVGLWSANAFVSTGNSNLTLASLNAESESGLLVGTLQNSAATGYAYDLNSKSFYSFGPANTIPNAANASGSVVGQDGGGTQGFLWSEATQSYSLIPGLFNAIGISSSGQLVAGQTGTSSTGQAVVYNTSTGATTTYWNGEATGVNNSGTVVGDTSVWQELNGSAMAYIGGRQINLSTAYAPSGVTFNYCQGLNNAGQILLWANGQWPDEFDSGNKTASYLLTPALPGDAVLEGKVDINDLTVVSAHFGQTAGALWSTGDFIGDGKVDINDLSIVLSHFGSTLGSAAGSTAAVPEPASVVLLACCGLALLAVVRRRRA